MEEENKNKWHQYTSSKGDPCWHKGNFYITPATIDSYKWQLNIRAYPNIVIDIAWSELRKMIWDRSKLSWRSPNPSNEFLATLPVKEYILYLTALKLAKEIQDNWDAFTINRELI